MAFLGTGLLSGRRSLGANLGDDLVSALQGLAHHKIQQRQSHELEKIGFPKELASIFHSLDPKVQQDIWKQVNLNAIGQDMQQNQQTQQGFMQNQPMIGQPQQLQSNNPMDALNSLGQQNRNQGQQQFNPIEPSVDASQRIGQVGGQQQIAQQLAQNQQPKGIFQQQAKGGNELLAKEQIATQTRAKISAEKNYEEVVNKAQEAERKATILDEMEKLVPKVSGGTRSNIARLTGSSALLTSPETQQFDKLAADLLPMGLTQQQLISERLKFPNSGLSTTANRRLIQDLKRKYNKDIEQGQLAETIVTANNGEVPTDFRRIVHTVSKSQSPQNTELVKKKEAEPLSSQSVSPEDEVSNEEGFLSSSLRNIIGAGANAVSSLANLPSLPENLAKHAEQTRNQMVRNALKPGNEKSLYGSDAEETRKALEKLEANPIKGVAAPIIEKAHDIAKSVFPKGYLQPKNETEEVFQDYAAMVPLFILSGGSANIKDIAGFIGRTAVGREVGRQVKESGGGEIGRITSEIAIPALLSAMNPYRVAREFKSIQGKDYNENLPKLAENKFVNAKPLEDALEEAAQLGRRSAGRTRHLDNINDWASEISNGQLPLSRLQPLKKEINKLAYQQNNDAYKPIASALKKMGEDTLKTHPEYGQALNRADSIHQIYANAEDMKDFIKDSTRTIPLKKSYLIKKGIEILLNNPAVEGAKTLVKLGVKFPKETADYALKAFSAAAKKQTPAFLKEVEKLGRLSQEVEKE